MESVIDERYRLLLLEHQVEGSEQRVKGNKWIFCCPLCSPFAKTKAKSKEKKEHFYGIKKETVGSSVAISATSAPPSIDS